MVEFETIESTEVKFGNNNFIEVGKKKAITEEGENQFISLSRGFFTPDGEKRYKKNFSLPNDAEVVKQIIDALENLNVDEKKEEVQEEETEDSTESDEDASEEIAEEDEDTEEDEEEDK